MGSGVSVGGPVGGGGGVKVSHGEVEERLDDGSGVGVGVEGGGGGGGDNGGDIGVGVVVGVGISEVGSIDIKILTL